ncbi:DNA repair protein RecO [Aquibacillus koreensis]|uniref:DNA repair protein RecO n=1 Tax=Aquibacillus koreensis TaxID=279446 RepID=A0A9X3WKG2_9BACI|nr:DNA repair protein RecO [Aquibacillus koreensis]MCT2537593.1 DNA repair protein RecO [Aquibacillus koreensis]MDC3419039.1 DNA repair protein RecO [Aquibacillus koreensis]
MFDKVEGIILRTQNYGETHKIVTIFTGQTGKIGAIARGAKKPKSRMAAITQPFIHGSFLIQSGRGLATIQQGEVISSLRSIREDIIKTAYATYIAELTDKLLDEKVVDVLLYKQLLKTLQWIADDKDPEILTIIYELKMYKRAGFAPVVTRCVHCGQQEQSYSFSVAEGGFLCSRCQWKDPNATNLPNNLSKLLYIFSEIDIERIGNISIKPENKKLLQQLMELYYERYGGYYLKSKKFLKQLDLLK